MRTVQDIQFDVTGQTLIFDAPEGRPSSVTSVSVFRWDQGDDDTAEFSPTGTVEANPNTSTDAACGVSQTNPRNVPLTATTSVSTGRTYLLADAATVGLKEWVEVESVTSADSVRSRHPLHNDYASGATFVSTRITAPVDSTWVADSTNIDDSAGPNPMFRVRWVYVVGGSTYVADTYINLVRYPGRHGVTPQDVESTYNGWLDTLPQDHRNDQGRRLIDEAHRAVKIDLHQIRFDDAALAEAEIVDEFVRLKTIERTEFARFLRSGSLDQARHLAAKLEYTTRLEALVRLVSNVPERDRDGAAHQRSSLSLTVR